MKAFYPPIIFPPPPVDGGVIDSVPEPTLVLKLNELVAVIVFVAPTIALKMHHVQVDAAPTVNVDVPLELVFVYNTIGLVLVPTRLKPPVNVKLAPRPI